MLTTFDVRNNPDTGLHLCWSLPNGLELMNIPLRVHLQGYNVFSVWGTVDSGEGAPAWAEPELEVVFFNGTPDSSCEIERAGDRYRVTGTHPRAQVTLELRLAGDELQVRMAISNPQPLAGKALPLCTAELRFEELTAGAGGEFYSAHPYGGRTHGFGKLAALGKPGVSFVHGCIGQALPLVYLHDPAGKRGVEFEFMLDERPIAWLRPGSSPERAAWCLSWSTDRLLAPGQTHVYSGTMRLTAYTGDPVVRMRQWRDAAAERYGLRSPYTPVWLRKSNIIEFNMNPNNKEHAFTRLDDPRCREILVRWKEMGYDAIFAVSHNHVGINWLSPFDYEPSEEVGGFAGERQVLDWAHELGFHIFLWVTTVGIDRNAPEVKEHPEWFTHRPDGSLFYAWDSSEKTGFVGYAPDGDPQSTGWRNWLKEQVRGVITRGFDGIFIDGCIPRASNHARWAWPGEGRNGVEDQVIELADFVRGLGKDLITFVEDESLALQAACEMTMGRYHPVTPYFKKAYWDHGMGGGPEVEMAPPEHIPPEMARDYLRIRYASLLPDGASNDILEGYISEAVRPWTAQSLFAGMVPKTHSNYVHTPEQFIPIPDADPPAVEREPAHRLRGHEEFLRMLQFCRDEPLVREAPLSLEGVIVDGDAGVVGILRPTGDRCLLALVQFADRPARVSVRLADPVDVPAIDRAAAGHPEQVTWIACEIMHSMVETDDAAPGLISGEQALSMTLGAYGFRLFELMK